MTENGFIINRVFRPYWKALSIAFVAVLIEGAASIFDPWPIKIVIDYALGSRSMPEWIAGPVRMTFGEGKLAIVYFAAIATVVVAAVGAVASYTQNYLTTKVGQMVMLDLRQTLYHHIQRLSLSFYDRTKIGDLISRVTTDVDAIQSFVSTALLGIVAPSLTLVGMLAVMFYFNWRFTLIALSVAPILFLQVYTLTRRIKQATRAVRKKESEIVSVVAETLSSIRVVKAFAREDYEMKRLEKETLESIEMTMRARSIKARLAPIVDVIVAVGTCIVLWYGARLVLQGQLTAGALVVFLLYLGKMYKPMRDLSKMTDTISKAMIGAERIKELISLEDSVRDLPHARTAPRFKGRIEFDRVYFGYYNAQPVLKDVSLRIEPGQYVALVGPTGAGKSSIIGLIPRFYDPFSGGLAIERGGHAQLHLEVSARANQLRSARDDSLPRADLAEHRLRQTRSLARRDHPRRPARQRARIHRADAGRLRHDGRRARRDALRRPAPAYRHRPRHHPQLADPHPRRANFGA